MIFFFFRSIRFHLLARSLFVFLVYHLVVSRRTQHNRFLNRSVQAAHAVYLRIVHTYARCGRLCLRIKRSGEKRHVQQRYTTPSVPGAAPHQANKYFEMESKKQNKTKNHLPTDRTGSPVLPVSGVPGSGVFQILQGSSPRNPVAPPGGRGPGRTAAADRECTSGSARSSETAFPRARKSPLQVNIPHMVFHVHCTLDDERCFMVNIFLSSSVHLLHFR